MAVSISRRRAITVLAAAVGLPLLLNARKAEARMIRWEGTTLGAPSTIQLYHQDEAKARAAIDDGLRELARMEAVFSINRPDSVISRLNREGRIDNAPAEFTELLTHSLHLADISGGVYDPTIQPVWNLYFQHFTAAQVDPAGPSPADLKNALGYVNWRDIEIDSSTGHVAFKKPGMGLTLNSGGQGYITDRVAAILRGHGFEKMLVDMGEPRALSTKPDGSAWRIGLANPADPSRAIAEVDVVDKCVSTSGGYGTIFDPNGEFTHIIHPKTGKTAPAMLGVSVIADTATKADGLSTAMILIPEERRQDLLRAAGAEMAYFVTPKGVMTVIKA